MTKVFDRLREPFNCLSHGFGVLLSIVALFPLLYFATGFVQYLAVSMYGLSLFLLYLSSAVYHGLTTSDKVLVIFQHLDRTAIYLLIAGTTTPIALISLTGWVGWTLFGLIWGISLAGIVLSIMNPFEGRWPSTISYLVAGWVSILFIKPIINVFSWQAFLWCLSGGLLYTVGAIIYACDWPEIHTSHFGAHELWHVFVMMGSGTHFVFILFYTI